MSDTLQCKRPEQSRARPAHVRDFDLNAGLHELRDVSDTPQQQIWATPLWQNLLFVVAMVGALGVAAFVCLGPDEWLAQAGSQVPDVLRWMGVAICAVTALLSGFRAIHRGQLVLDRRGRTLCFHYLLLSPRTGRRQLSLDDIATLDLRALRVAGDDDDGSWTSRVVVAKLRDGRLASIAFDSTPGIAGAIRAAIDQRSDGPVAGAGPGSTM